MALPQRSIDRFLDLDTPPQRATASVFYFSGPSKPPGKSAANDGQPERQGRTATGPLVLVVDDDPEHCAYMAEVLSRRGCRVGMSLSGRDAIRRLESETFETVVTDVYMPDLDGIELVRTVRERWPAIRLIAVTGGGLRLPDSVPNFLKYLGVFSILSKPFEPRELVEAVEAATPDSDD
jgi:two-component system, chemotaxis family, chemotaxis protein CheY